MKIVSAYYGAYNVKARDVTAWVAGIVQRATGRQVEIFVAFETFDIPDPAPGIRKSLTVNYQAGDMGGVLCKSGVDGSTITLDLQSNLIEIASATYGSDTIFLDITGKVQVYLQEAYSNTTLPMVGNPDFFNRFCDNRDIAPNVPKTLTLSFYRGREQITVCASDGQTVDLLNDF